MPHYQAVIGCIPERSSFNAALILARALAGRGHRVTIVGSGTNEFRRHVERHGFAFLGLGSPAMLALAAKANGTRNPITAVARWNDVFRQLISDLDGLARTIKPDLAFLDVLAANPAAYLLSGLRIPTFLFHGGMLSAKFSSRYPPVWSPMVVAPEPRASSALWRARCVAAWGKARVQRRLKLLGARRAPVPAVMQACAAWRVRRRAARNGWRFCYGDWGKQPDLPEVVMGNRAFDWPQLRTDRRCYLSGGATPRVEFDGSWASGLDARKKLVYCVTSTMIQPRDVFEPDPATPVVRKRAMPLKRFLDAIVAIVGGRPDWQLVMACGPFAMTYEESKLPANVRVSERAPQTEVLQRASLMITQAGAGAVREAVSFGVPMLAYPLWTDQFGNAARVVYHGIGAQVDIACVRKEELAALMARLIEGPEARSAVAKLSAECARDAEHEMERFADFVKRHGGLEV
jgi:UDP-N-acetylglucosamine:LPS N-acetylglucosamine transferase